MELDGTVALVTGASSGIGEATARALASRGAQVAVAARRKDRLDALAGEIGGLAIEADITDRDQATAAVERTVAELGRLDIVINNAGVMMLGPIVDAPVEEWDRMVALNVQGLLYVAHAALAAPAARRRVRAAPRRRPRQRQLGRRPPRRLGRRRLPAHQARRRRVQRVAAPGGDRAPRARLARSSRERSTPSSSPTCARRSASGSSPTRVEKLRSEDIADAIAYIVTRPRHMAVNEILVRPTRAGALGDAVDGERAVVVARVLGDLAAEPGRRRVGERGLPCPGTRSRP